MTQSEKTPDLHPQNTQYTIQMSYGDQSTSIPITGDLDGPQTFNEQEWQQIFSQAGVAQPDTRLELEGKIFHKSK